VNEDIATQIIDFPDGYTNNFIVPVDENNSMNWTAEQLSLKKKYPNLVIMCPLDHCHCTHNITETIEYCPLCGEPVCPDCGSHDVSQVSRVTGYLADVAGWNQGKQQELKDRARYTIA
jgi:hypothetical protein